jgi:hypothetical protein
MKQSLRLQPIDRLSLALILSLGLVIGLAIWGKQNCGDRCWIRVGPRVQRFSWQDKRVGAADRAFILTFDRPVDRAGVEQNLEIVPPLAGKISWAGRLMAYTLEAPVPYGETYQVRLKNVREKFRRGKQTGEVMQPFSGSFQSRDRAFAYIGTQGGERGRLIFYNLTAKHKTILTPPELMVVDFQFYPQGDRIVLAAGTRHLGNKGLQELQLYSVTTSMASRGSEVADFENFKPELSLILDNRDYQNNQFDLAPDGQTIVLQRINRRNPSDFDLWAIREGRPPQPLKIQGGEFSIAPDSQTLAVARGEGISLLPLQSGAEPLDYLPKFGQLLGFSRDGTAAAMVDFNSQDASRRYLRSLFYVNNQGIQKELLSVAGSIRHCQFNALGTQLFCLLTQLEGEGELYVEKPYFAQIDLKAGKAYPLASFPPVQDIQMSLAPDDLGILFDQVQPVTGQFLSDGIVTDSGSAIADSRLWLLIPPSSDTPKAQLKELPFAGYRPRWMP